MLLLAAGIGGAISLDTGAGTVLAGYAVVMVAYSWQLKAVAILDVLILSAGVVARAVSGALVIDVAVSPWLYICTSFGALFVAVSKRWAEARDLGPAAASHRPSLALYTMDLLNHLLVVAAAGALLSYSIYSIESDHVPTNGAMAATIPFVAFAMFRYLLLLGGPRRGDAPDRILFTDPQILVAVAGFAVVAVWVLVAN
jgi:4-hydroxybenzoate polyprenyltransferase